MFNNFIWLKPSPSQQNCIIGLCGSLYWATNWCGQCSLALLNSYTHKILWQKQNSALSAHSVFRFGMILTTNIDVFKRRRNRWERASCWRTYWGRSIALSGALMSFIACNIISHRQESPYMYVCMYVCMYAMCVCVCVCVCIYIYAYVWMNVCMYVCMDVRMYACTYVHILSVNYEASYNQRVNSVLIS